MPADLREVADYVEKLLSRMTLEERLGQLFMVGFSGTEPDAGIREWIERCHLGNVVLFAGNLVDPPQVLRLTGELQALAMAAQEASAPVASQGHGFIPLFIAADQEGGIVVRLTRGATVFPGNMALGATRDPELARRAAAVMGYEMRAVGIQFNLAPVLDVNCNPRNPVIGVRSYGEDPELVAELGAAQIEGYQQFVVATAKHFPGHGDTAVDSHLARPVVGHGRERLLRVELLPFRRAIAAGVGAIMTAHLSVPAIEPDPRLPATLSRRVVTGLLREELGYDGIIITDSLGMRGVSAEYDMVEASLLALEAGCDILCASSHTYYGTFVYDAVLAAVRAGRISEERIAESARRVLRAKARFGLLGEGGPGRGYGSAWAWAAAGAGPEARPEGAPVAGMNAAAAGRGNAEAAAVAAAEAKGVGRAGVEGPAGGDAGTGGWRWHGGEATLAAVGSPAHRAVAMEVARRAITQVKGPAALPEGAETVIVVEFSAQAQTGVEDLRLERGTSQGQGQGQTRDPAEGAAQSSGQGLAQSPVQGQVQSPALGPVQGQVQVLAQSPKQSPVQGLAQSLAQGPRQRVAQSQVQSPVQGPVQGPEQSPAQGLAQGSAQTLAQSPAQGPAQSVAQSPEQSPAQGLAQGLAQSPGPGPVQGPAQSQALGPMQGLVQGPARGAAQGPAQGEALRQAQAQTSEGGPLAAALQELLGQRQSPGCPGAQVLSLVLPLNPDPNLRQRLLAQLEAFASPHARDARSADQPGREADQPTPAPATPAATMPARPGAAPGQEMPGGGGVAVVVATLDAVRNAGQAELIRELTAAGSPVWVVSLRNPYELSSLGATDEKVSFLVAYSPQPVSLAAAAEALAGVLIPTGQLPVTLP